MNFSCSSVRRASGFARLRVVRALATALLPLVVLALAATVQAQTDRPNVVVFLIDDGAFMDLGTYGGEARTPTIDALAKRGALFAIADLVRFACHAALSLQHVACMPDRHERSNLARR